MSGLPKRRRTGGFSLVETLVVTAIVSAIAAITFSAFAVQSDTMLRERGNAVSQNRLRTVVDRLVRELQSAGFDPLGSGSFGLIEATSDTVRFTVDADRDGVLDPGASERRGFDLEGGVIRAWLGGDPADSVSWRPLMPGVLSLNLLYLDENGLPTALLSAMRQVRITLSIRSEGKHPRLGPAILTHTAHAELRNLD